MPFRYEQSGANELRQGEILGPVTDFRTRNPAETAAGVDPLVDPHPHNLVLLVTADCDLWKDYANRQDGVALKLSDRLEHVLVCDMYTKDEIAVLTPPGFGNKDRRRLEQNQDERYHRFPRAEIRDSGAALDEMYLDFKRCLGFPIEQLYAQISRGQIRRVARLPDVFLQDVTHRLYGFLSRVGPEFD